MTTFNKRTIIPIALIIFILLMTIGMPMDAWAQSLFGGGYDRNLRYRGPNPVELGFIRGLIMAVSFGIGWAIGWLVSPESREFRQVVLFLGGGVAILTALISNTALGWSLTSLLAIVLFFIGIGYWIGRAVSGLFEVPTTFGSASWAKPEELKQHGLFTAEGIRLGQAFDGEEMETIAYNGDRHALLVAPARTGKGTTQIVSNLLSYEGPILTIDPKGENAMMTAKSSRSTRRSTS